MRSVEEIKAEIMAEAKKTGYMLNPDEEILDGIIEGIAINENQLGYWSCPCRMASGSRMADFDIICPCEYRDPDLDEYGRCYCALYVNQEYVDAGMPTEPIPERRPESKQNSKTDPEETQKIKDGGKEIKVWRCDVCGYLCARPGPPSICPICRAKKDRFEEFSMK
ncbi:ferredoxin:glutaredoxin reductase [Candidatus Poribacteria bacterium]|nr:ferredoxin:glutaredoxin reductase [Candidatus Poribacteria bacterium]